MRRPLLALLTAALVPVLLLAGCGSDSSSEAEATTSTEATESSTTTAAPPTDTADAPVTREALIELAEEEFAETPPSTLPGQAEGEWSSCWADRLLEEIGAERLAELQVTEIGLFSSALLLQIVEDIDETAAYLTPMFDCTDVRPLVLGDLGRLDPDEAACVADAVLADREVRLLFVVGTTDDRDEDELSADWQALVDEYDAMVAACTT
jgi:hypothetical protein